MSKIERKEAVALATSEITEALKTNLERVISIPDHLTDSWGNMTLDQKNDYFEGVVTELYWEIDSALKILQADLSLAEVKDS